jgi:hypothetical protein
MKFFIIPEIFIKAIKNQALSSENEIYGWLLGYEKENIPHILAIFECKSFDHQTLISAVPNAQEFQELSSLMPQGIGPIGIYHSHPFSSEVFHSHTDDSTLISLSNQFPNCISIVTNGQEINYYQMGKNSKTKEVKTKLNQPSILNHFILQFQDNIDIKIDKRILNDESKLNNLNIQIINHLREYYENNWKYSQFIVNEKPIIKKDMVAKYLKESGDPIKLSFAIPPSVFSSKKEEIILSKGEEGSDISQDCMILKLRINTKLPIYLKQENVCFEQLDDTIRTELLSNNILRKIYDSIIDFENKEVILPQDYFLEYFGFLIRFLIFKEPVHNKRKLSQKNKKLIVKLISQFKPFIGIELLQSFKLYFKRFLKDVERFSNKFDWYEEVDTQINNLYTDLKL